MMERLTKRQRQILTYLYKRFRVVEDAEYVTLVNYLGGKTLDAYTDIELLKEKGLIEVDPQFKRFISITPKGIEKLQETFFTRIKDEIHKRILKNLNLHGI
jgi:hypothetical protein